MRLEIVDADRAPQRGVQRVVDALGECAALRTLDSCKGMAQPWEENNVCRPIPIPTPTPTPMMATTVDMIDALKDVPSLAGDKTLAVFHRAGFKTVRELYVPGGQAARIEQAIADMKGEAVAAGGAAPVLDSVWRGLQARCFAIIARIRSAEAMPVPPRPFCCHIMPHEMMTHPVLTKYGDTYERANIVRHIQTYSNDPLSGLPLSVDDLVPNLALRDAIEYFNLHFMRFAVPLHPRR